MKTFGELSRFMRFMFGSAWLLTLTMLVIVLVLYTDNKRTKECLANYIRKDNAATEARQGPAAAERAALTKIFKAVVGPAAAKEARPAIDEYNRLVATNDKIRDDNPYPEVPKSCGGDHEGDQ